MSSVRRGGRILAMRFVAGLSLLLCGCGGSEGGAQRVLTRKPGSNAATAQCTGTGAHDEHAATNIGCAVCHPCGGVIEFSGYTYTRGTTATGTVTPATSTTPTTCAVGCHSPIGAPAHTVAWNQGPLDCTACHTPTALPSTHPALAPTVTGADCVVCHDMSKHTTGTIVFVPHPATWMTQSDPGFHAFSANKGLAACQGCHGQDLTGGITGVACAQCHDQNLPSGVTTWKQNCLMCHGATDNTTGAPPRTTWGNSADLVRVGAHTAHVTASPLSPAFDCALCHVKPADALAPGHIDGPTATVTFNGMAIGTTGTPAPAWDRTSATCSNTYCHGAFRNGNAANLPVWTGGPPQGACGSCHGLPPTAAAHPAVGNDLTICAVCHPKTMDGNGNIIPPSQGGLHLDGLIEAAGHDASWMDTSSSNFHAFSAVRGLSGCQACHGQDLSGGTTGVACAQCHNPGWQTNCTMCHGGVANSTGAPPNSIWGTGDPQRGGGTPDPIRVGAHTAHVQGTLASSFDCGQCHLTPTDAFSAGHIDGPYATVTFGELAVQGTKPPVYSRPNGATCASTYCHGGYAGTYTYTTWDWGLDQPVPTTVPYAGKGATPLWTDGPMTCSSCHDNPPRNGTWHSGLHGYQADGYNNCQLCHPDAIGTAAGGTSISNPALHVNGTVDVTPQWQSKCFGCH